MRRARPPSAAAGAAFAAALALSACGGDAADEGTAEQPVVARTTAADVPAWLSQTEAMDPARWIASREAGRLVPESDPRTAALRAGLDRAGSAFIEDRRMIANRTVQLGQMLAEAGMPERYAGLLDGFVSVAGARHRRQLYGEMCQHYFNARSQGDDPPAALARLTERYGAQAGVEGSVEGSVEAGRPGGTERAEPSGSPR